MSMMVPLPKRNIGIRQRKYAILGTILKRLSGKFDIKISGDARHEHLFFCGVKPMNASKNPIKMLHCNLDDYVLHQKL